MPLSTAAQQYYWANTDPGNREKINVYGTGRSIYTRVAGCQEIVIILSILSGHSIACGKYGFPVNNPEKNALAVLPVISRNKEKKNDKAGNAASESPSLEFPAVAPSPQPPIGEMSRTACRLSFYPPHPGHSMGFGFPVPPTHPPPKEGSASIQSPQCFVQQNQNNPTDIAAEKHKEKFNPSCLGIKSTRRPSDEDHRSSAKLDRAVQV
jgi:hypothetical protein